MNSLNLKEEQGISTNALMPINVNDKDFEIIMSVYRKALEQVYKELIQIKEKIQELYGYNIINNITYRIKTPNSIINKMKKKHCKLDYRSLYIAIQITIIMIL